MKDMNRKRYTVILSVQCICKGFGRRYIMAEVASGPMKGKKLHLPLVKLSPSDYSWQIKLSRRQFSIKPAFAMTVSKSKSQSSAVLGLCFKRPVFLHG